MRVQKAPRDSEEAPKYNFDVSLSSTRPTSSSDRRLHGTGAAVIRRQAFYHMLLLNSFLVLRTSSLLLRVFYSLLAHIFSYAAFVHPGAK